MNMRNFFFLITALGGMSCVSAPHIALPEPEIQVWTESGDSDFIFYQGRAVDIRFRTNRDAYVIVAALDAENRKTILFPNSNRPGNAVSAGEVVNLSETTALRALRRGPVFIKAFVCTSPAFALNHETNPMPFWWPALWGAAYMDQKQHGAFKYQAFYDFGEPVQVTRGEVEQLTHLLNRRIDESFAAFEPLVQEFVESFEGLFLHFDEHVFNSEEMLLYIAEERFNPDRYLLIDQPEVVSHRFDYTSTYYRARVESEAFYEPLNGYGDWVDMNGVSAWVPTVNIIAWKPFLRGHWEYNSWGWTWAPDPGEPWGVITFRYGYWTRSPRYGWAWIPRRAPVVPYWMECGDYMGWGPRPLPPRLRRRMGFRRPLFDRCGVSDCAVFTNRSAFPGRHTRGIPYHTLRYVWKRSDIERRVTHGNRREVLVRSRRTFEPDSLRRTRGITVVRRPSGEKEISFSSTARGTRRAGISRSSLTSSVRQRGVETGRRDTAQRAVMQRTAAKATRSPVVHAPQETVSRRSSVSSRPSRTAGSRVVSLSRPRHTFERTVSRASRYSNREQKSTEPSRSGVQAQRSSGVRADSSERTGSRTETPKRASIAWPSSGTVRRSAGGTVTQSREPVSTASKRTLPSRSQVVRPVQQAPVSRSRSTTSGGTSRQPVARTTRSVSSPPAPAAARRVTAGSASSRSVSRGRSGNTVSRSPSASSSSRSTVSRSVSRSTGGSVRSSGGGSSSRSSSGRSSSSRSTSSRRR